MTVGVELLLAFADDEHLMGQHHTEWIGVAPFLEEDLAFSSIGQDELGHAVLLYERVLHLQGVEVTDAAVDDLAYRAGDAYRSCAFTELVTDDWATALVRHWIYDAAEGLRWQQFAESADQSLREIAVVAERDEAFHRRHADALLDRLLADPAATPRVLEALDALLPLVPSLLAATGDTDDAIAAGIVSGSVAELRAPLRAAIADRFGVAVPEFALASGRRLERSVDFGPLMARMREVLDLDATAVW